MKRGLQYLVPLILSGLGLVLFNARAAEAQAPGDDLEVILAIDTSASMRPAIDAAKAAATEFVASMPAGVAIGVETFADDVEVLAPPTTDRALVSGLISRIATGGNTALYDGVVAAGQQFTPTVTNKVLVLLSDGKDDGSTATLDEAVAATNGAHVEAISLTTKESDIASLQALGTVTPADDAAGVSAAFDRVASLLAAVVEPTTVPTTAAPATAVPTATVPITALLPAAVAAPATTVSQQLAPPAVPSAQASTSGSSATLWLGAAGLFLSLFLLGLLFFPRNKVSKARLGIDKPRSVSEMGKRTVAAVDDALERHGKRAEFATSLSVADISMQPGEFVGAVAAVALVAGLVGLMLGGPLVGLLVAAAVCFGVRAYVGRTKAKRRAAFAEQLPDVLQLVTTALRSGFGLTQALDSIAEEAEEPARSEFAHVLVEARLGRDLSEGMRALALRMQSEDLEWVVAAIDINRDTGGNLSE
ncbi:MAG TPA: VWA domain-containing protein, partial [Ilumatobacteraceae bacterium]